MGQILYLNTINYKFVTIPTYHEKNIMGTSEPIIKQICLIGIQHITKNRRIVHPFSEFVLELKNKEYSTMKNRAESIVRFLNYILQNNDIYKLTTLSNLSERHGTDYLNSLAYNFRSIQYINTEDNNITAFYYFLAKKKLLNNVSIDNFNWYEHKNKVEEIKYLPSKYLISYFPDTEKPSNKGSRKRRLHHIVNWYL